MGNFPQKDSNSETVVEISRKDKTRPTKRAPDAGDSAHIPSSFHALAVFWLDGFAVPAPAQVTQTVRRLPSDHS